MPNGISNYYSVTDFIMHDGATVIPVPSQSACRLRECPYHGGPMLGATGMLLPARQKCSAVLMPWWCVRPCFNFSLSTVMRTTKSCPHGFGVPRGLECGFRAAANEQYQQQRH
jgi:hypothetical protein